MPEATAYNCALRLLTRREHSAAELKDKLRRKGYTEEESEQSIADCQRLGLQSDRRYVESLLRSRSMQGYGPMRIRQELGQNQVESELIEEVFQQEAVDWLEKAAEVWDKKARGQKDQDAKSLQKLKRFLLYRGFPSDIIQQLVS